MNIRIGLYRVLEPYLDDEDDIIYFPDDTLDNGHSWREDVCRYFERMNVRFYLNIEDFIEQTNISWYSCSIAWVENDEVCIEDYRIKITY